MTSILKHNLSVNTNGVGRIKRCFMYRVGTTGSEWTEGTVGNGSNPTRLHPEGYMTV